MTEIQKLIMFMRTGNRTEVFLEEYLRLQELTGKWTRKRQHQLLRELSFSKVCQVSYKKESDRSQRIIFLKK